MQIKARQKFAVLGSLLLAGAGIVAAQQKAPPPPPSQFKVMSPAYSEGSHIPTQFTCADSKAGSPALEWSDPPKGTMSFALIFHDTEAAPAKGTMDVTHWILWDIPASSTSIPAGIAIDATPDGIMQGKNVRGVNGYQPPCPPPGATAHHYIFELYALDTKLDLPAGTTRADLLKAMDGHVIGKAAYVGLVNR